MREDVVSHLEPIQFIPARVVQSPDDDDDDAYFMQHEYDDDVYFMQHEHVCLVTFAKPNMILIE